ncbi:MAG: translation initiation factor IF-2, partial [Thermoplasmata archaeon]
GAPVRVVKKGEEARIMEEILKESAITVKTDETGVFIKADAVGSLEAIAFELRNAKVSIKRAEIGDISKKDIIDTATIPNPLDRAIIAFNVKLLPDAKAELSNCDVKVLTGDIIYRLVEDYQKWVEERKSEIDKEKRSEIVHPGKILILPDHTFRVSKPAIVGVRVLAGRIRVGHSLLRQDGETIGTIKSIRVEEESMKEARQGAEVAIAVDGVTVGRQIKEGDILFTYIPESHVKLIDRTTLTSDEVTCLDEICFINRKSNKFWGM